MGLSVSLRQYQSPLSGGGNGRNPLGIFKGGEETEGGPASALPRFLSPLRFPPSPDRAAAWTHETAPWPARTGYAVSQVLGNTIVGPGELSSKVDRFILGVQPSLSNVVAALRRDEPEQFALFAGGRPILQAILADSAQSRPVMMTVSFAVDGTGTVQPHAARIDGAGRSGPRIIYAGQQDRIRAYLQSHHDWIAGDNAALVQKLVQLEVEARSPWVGGPVDVVEISGCGPRWVQSKSGCRE